MNAASRSTVQVGLSKGNCALKTLWSGSLAVVFAARHASGIITHAPGDHLAVTVAIVVVDAASRSTLQVGHGVDASASESATLLVSKGTVAVVAGTGTGGHLLLHSHGGLPGLCTELLGALASPGGELAHTGTNFRPVNLTVILGHVGMLLGTVGIVLGQASIMLSLSGVARGKSTRVARHAFIV